MAAHKAQDRTSNMLLSGWGGKAEESHLVRLRCTETGISYLHKLEETMICLEMRSVASYSLFIPNRVILAVCIFGRYILCKKQTELYNSHMSNIKQAMEDTQVH